MYVMSLACENARLSGTFQFSTLRCSNYIGKWNFLDGTEENRELLRLLVISCNSPRFWTSLPFPFDTLRGAGKGPLRVCHLRTLHDQTDIRGEPIRNVISGVWLDARGNLRSLSRAWAETFFEGAVLRNPAPKSVLRRDFLLAYGDDFSAHNGNDGFDFSDPLFRSRRFHSLFNALATLTDPSVFLGRLFYCGAKYKRQAPRHALERICSLMKKHFCIEIDHWLKMSCDGEREWQNLPPHLLMPFLPMLDAVRHVLDAFPKATRPLDLPGLILLDRPDRYCGDSILTAWLSFFDELFPNMQFFATIPERQQHSIPQELRQKELPLPVLRSMPPRRPSRCSSPDVLLIDVDSRLPNLALMKLSRYFKEQGRSVTLVRGVQKISSASEVYASGIFTFPASMRKMEELKGFYGEALQMGGSGVDLQRRLPAHIEKLLPDYDLYPELEDRAIGFLSRGCPFCCPFCIVPFKEGPPRQVSDLQSLMDDGRRKKLILLDDNLLSLPHADELLEEMAERGILVNFTQTLDLRFVTRRRAELLRRIGSSNTRFNRSNYYFSLNDTKNLPLVREKYDLFRFSWRDNVEFICMYGYNTTLAEDVARFRFLRALPGAYVFTQRYRPVPGGPPPETSGFFEGDPDRLISELISIQFTQNMKSMETYYRWVSRFYAETFGQLHMPLVDTIFRYNRREKKGDYIATLAGVKG